MSHGTSRSHQRHEPRRFPAPLDEFPAEGCAFPGNAGRERKEPRSLLPHSVPDPGSRSPFQRRRLLLPVGPSSHAAPRCAEQDLQGTNLKPPSFQPQTPPLTGILTKILGVFKYQSLGEKGDPWHRAHPELWDAAGAAHPHAPLRV